MTKYIETRILSHSSDLNIQSLAQYQAVKKNTFSLYEKSQSSL